MAIEFHCTIENTLLLVKTSGYDESLEEVQQYGLALIQACQEHGVTRVLCDESELEYRLGTLDIFESAAFMSQAAPEVARAAIVCNPRHAADAQFWETVAVNRGLQVRFFPDIEKARAWLAA